MAYHAWRLRAPNIPNQSNTWEDLGLFALALEQSLGHNESGTCGLDTLSLGLSNAAGGPTLDSQIMADIETEHCYNGVFRLQQQPMNLPDSSQLQQCLVDFASAQYDT